MHSLNLDSKHLVFIDESGANTKMARMARPRLGVCGAEQLLPTACGYSRGD